jgi:hypothetical protein
MSIALQLYINLIEAKDDNTRARLIAEAFDALEKRLTQLAAQTTSPPEQEAVPAGREKTANHSCKAASKRAIVESPTPSDDWRTSPERSQPANEDSRTTERTADLKGD